MADPASDLRVVIDDDTETVHVDPVTGTVTTDQPDGGKIVRLDAPRPKAANDDEDNGWFDNLADDIDGLILSKLTSELIDGIKADDTSRKGHLDVLARAMDLLGTQLREPRATVSDTSSALDGMSTVVNPLLLEAVLKGWANAQAELLPSNGPVKIRDDGNETVAQDDLAESFERDMNHWFTTTAAEYYSDTSHMLLWSVYLGGSGIKKIYRCPMRRRPVSESVPLQDFIVSDTTKDLRACGRLTHQISMRPSVMKRMQFIGAYRKVPLPEPTGSSGPDAVDAKIAQQQGTQAEITRPEDKPYTLWECQCELDLEQFIPTGSKFKGEGIPLPYIVTIDKDSEQVLCVRRDWDEDDDECERKRMYVKYPYVPGPGFYGTGLLNILGNCSAAMTAAWRIALDSGMFANFPGGVADKGATRQLTSDIRVGPGQFAGIETGGRDIRQVLMGLPYKDVTQGMLALIELITQQSKEVGGVADLPAGEGVQNVPVGTMLAAIEQATKVMSAAHKGQHRAQAEEIELICDLFRATPEDFWRSNKVCPKDYWTEEKFFQALDDCNLVPASDPNVPSHIHRIAKAVALSELIVIPPFAAIMDPKETLTRILGAMREDTNGLIITPAVPPAPPPSLADQAKMLSAQAAQQNASTNAAKVNVDAQGKGAELQTEQEIAGLNLQKELVIHSSDQAQAAQESAHDRALSTAQHGLATQQHGLDVASAAHDQNMDVAQHALDVHQALNPPEPAQPTPGSGSV